MSVFSRISCTPCQVCCGIFLRTGFSNLTVVTHINMYNGENAFHMLKRRLEDSVSLLTNSLLTTVALNLQLEWILLSHRSNRF